MREAIRLGLVGLLGLIAACTSSPCPRDAITDPAGRIVGYVEHCDDDRDH
jgi:hypothetical protein